jgi:hypothetical protein
VQGVAQGAYGCACADALRCALRAGCARARGGAAVPGGGHGAARAQHQRRAAPQQGAAAWRRGRAGHNRCKRALTHAAARLPARCAARATQLIVWHVEWVFGAAGVRAHSRVREDQPLRCARGCGGLPPPLTWRAAVDTARRRRSAALAAQVGAAAGGAAARHALRAYSAALDAAPAAAAEAAAAAPPPPAAAPADAAAAPAQPAAAQPTAADVAAEEDEALHIYMEKVGVPAGASARWLRLRLGVPLRAALAGCWLLEHPTLHVALPSERDAFPLAAGPAPEPPPEGNRWI